MGQLARHAAKDSRLITGIAALVLADLRRFRGKHGQAVGIIDLDLDRVGIMHQGNNAIPQAARFAEFAQGRNTETAAGLDQRRKLGPQRVVKDARHRDVPILRHQLQFVHFMAAQNFPQGATDDDNQHEGQPGKIPEQIELTHLYRLSNVGATFRSDRTPESIVT